MRGPWLKISTWPVQKEKAGEQDKHSKLLNQSFKMAFEISKDDDSVNSICCVTNLNDGQRLEA